MTRYSEAANPAKFCIICQKSLPTEDDSPDREYPFRCHECFAAVAANEADGEL